MDKITSAKCFRPLIALLVIFAVTVATGSLTAPIYANAFFYCAKGIVVSFCAFLVIDLLRWFERTALGENPHQSKTQEIGWTIAVLLFMGYFLWRRWYHFSLWQIWVTAIVMAILLIGMLIRLSGKWDADCVRWITWATSCLLVTVSIVGTIVIFKPLTFKEAEEIVRIETCATDYELYTINESKTIDAPLGYYIFHRKQEDGTWGSMGTGRAVLYFGEGKETWRTAEPGSKEEYTDEITLEGTVFTYNGEKYNFAELEELELANLVYNLYEYRRIGDHILILGSIGKNAEYYAVFNPSTQTFERGITAAHFIYQEDNIQSAVYSFEKSIYRYDGSLIKTLDLAESEYIYDISFDETGDHLLVDLARITTDTPSREEIISLQETEAGSAKKHDLEMIPSAMLAPGVYDALRDDWKMYDALSAEEKLLSSHIPGNCKKDFDDWSECETFIGFAIPNPLENTPDFEKGTYVGMPIGFMDAPRIQASWYGTKDGHVEWLSVQSGYRYGQIRVVVDAKLYGDPAEEKPTDKGWSSELDRQWYLANTDSGSPIITEDSTEKHVANTAHLAQGYVLYSIRVIGETTMLNDVQETLDRILPLFSVDEEDHV